MRTCFKEILQTTTHRVGGICDNSRQKIIRLSDAELTKRCGNALKRNRPF